MEEEHSVSWLDVDAICFIYVFFLLLHLFNKICQFFSKMGAKRYIISSVGGSVIRIGIIYVP